MTKKQIIISLKKYRVSFDGKTYIIQEFRKGGINVRTKEVGSDHWTDVAYYGRLEHVVSGLVERHFELPDGTLQSQLKDILVELKRVEETILKEFRNGNQTNK